MLEADGRMKVRFYNCLHQCIGRYIYEELEDNRMPSDLFISIDYRHEAIDYLKTVGVKINE